MKKILSILICICILAFSLVACCGSGTAEAKVEELDRFYIASEAFDIGNTYHAGVILVDRETNVCYLYTSGANRSALSVLLDADGKPLIWEGKK